METVLVQINNNKAYKLLESLEDLHLIKVLKKSIQQMPTEKSSMAQFWGKISDETAQKLHANAKQMRDEWERDI